ncbi:hypothetical protein D3C86_1096910 [compost metagenome]
MAATNDLDRLNGRQTADFRGAGARCPGRVDAVDVEAQVHRAATDFLADFSHQRLQRFVPALFGLNHTEALVAAPVEVVSGVALGAQADLHDTVRVQQAFFNGATEGGAVGDFLAEHVIVHIGVGVDVHQADLAVLFMDGTQDRQGDGVVAAQGQGDHIVFEDVVVGLFDDPHGIQQVEGVDRDVADVGNRQRVERRSAGRHVVRADHHRFRADFARPETGAGTQGSTDVQRHAYEGSVQAGSGIQMGESHHGGDAAEARHFVAAQWLVKNLVHG